MEDPDPGQDKQLLGAVVVNVLEDLACLPDGPESLVLPLVPQQQCGQALASANVVGSESLHARVVPNHPAADLHDSAEGGNGRVSVAERIFLPGDVPLRDGHSPGRVRIGGGQAVGQLEIAGRAPVQSQGFGILVQSRQCHADAVQGLGEVGEIPRIVGVQRQEPLPDGQRLLVVRECLSRGIRGPGQGGIRPGQLALEARLGRLDQLFPDGNRLGRPAEPVVAGGEPVLGFDVLGAGLRQFLIEPQRLLVGRCGLHLLIQLQADLADAEVGRRQRGAHGGVSGPLLQEVLVELERGQQQILAEVLEPGHLQQPILADPGEGVVHRRHGLAEVGLRLLAQLRLAILARHGLIPGLPLVHRRLRFLPVERGHLARHDQGAHGRQHQHRRQHRAQHGDAGVVSRPADVALQERLAAGQDRLIVHKALQIVTQLPRRLVAPGRVAVDGLVNDRLQIAGDTPPHASQWLDLCRRHLLDQTVAVMLVERRPQCDQFVQGQAQAVDVAAAIGLAVEGLRRHVTQRAEDVSGVGEVLAALGLGQAEVSDPDGAIEIQQQIAGLDVAVNDSLLVGVLQGIGHLAADAGHALPVVQLARSCRRR